MQLGAGLQCEPGSTICSPESVSSNAVIPTGTEVFSVIQMNASGQTATEFISMNTVLLGTDSVSYHSQ